MKQKVKQTTCVSKVSHAKTDGIHTKIGTRFT